MKSKNFIINITNKEDDNNYKYFEVCEKCRNKYLGKFDNNGNCITWIKISYENCYCKLVT
tara:strand:+ start:259 stop:438 length:180 start_codon:yes stop_codon:yes gene_type:complete